MRHDSYFQRYFQQAEPARQRRATNSNQKRMCALFLQSDPLLWDYMTKPVGRGGKGYVSSVHTYCCSSSSSSLFDIIAVGRLNRFIQ